MDDRFLKILTWLKNQNWNKFIIYEEKKNEGICVMFYTYIFHFEWKNNTKTSLNTLHITTLNI